MNTLSTANVKKSLLILFMLQTFSLATDRRDSMSFLPLWLESFTSLKGDFLQVQKSSNGDLVSSSEGSFALLKPNFLSWDIHRPDRQSIVMSESLISHYDRDLGTLTRRVVSGDTQSLQVLLGSAQELRAEYKVTFDEINSVYYLSRKDSTNDLNLIGIQFLDDELYRIKFIAANKNELTISFANLAYDSVMDPRDFMITPESDVEILYDEQ